MNGRTRVLGALLCAGLAGAMNAQAADIRIVNLDTGTGQGLDDATPAAPVGGNPGTTRGQQALVVFQFAADLWGAVLESDVPIFNTATFQPLSCDANSGVLGSAGTVGVFTFDAGPELPAGAIAGTWYHSALADALSQSDLASPGAADIRSRFNGKLGESGCLEGSGWYFGLDGATPAGKINFLNVVMHEMAHGLGFSGFGSLTTGARLQDIPDIYSSWVRDNSTGKMWNDMSDAERKTAALNDGNLVFIGAQVKAEAPLVLDPAFALTVTSPAAIAGNYEYAAAQFGPTPTPANFSGTFAVPTSDPLGCGSAPVTGVTGKIALVARGACAFTEKATNAQAGGAVAVIITNNQAGSIRPGGDGPSITIPVIAVRQTDGDLFRSNMPVIGGIAEQSGLSGTDANGNVQLYAPTVLAQGSSFSHFDTRLTPNAVMEYAITADLQANLDLDLTTALFTDLGWYVHTNSQPLLSCDTGIPTSIPGGIILGANIVATAKILAASSANVGAYRHAMEDYASGLLANGFITPVQAARLAVCLGDPQTQEQYNAWNPDMIFANGFEG